MHARDPDFRLLSGGQALAILVTVASGLAGCVTANDAGGAPPVTPGVVDQIREVDLTPPRPTGPAGDVVRAKGGNVVRANDLREESYYGDRSQPIAGKRRGNQGWDSD